MLKLICGERGDNPYLDCPQQSSRLHKLRGPYAIPGRYASTGQHLGLSSQATGAAFGRNRGGRRLRDFRNTPP